VGQRRRMAARRAPKATANRRSRSSRITVPSSPSSGRRRAMVGQRAQIALEPVRDGAAGVFHRRTQVDVAAARIRIERAKPLPDTSPSAELCSVA